MPCQRTNEMLIENERKDILCGCFKQDYFKGNEVHVSIINLKRNNTASIQLKELLLNLYKIFKKSEFKYIIFIQYSNHELEKLRLGVQFKSLEKWVRQEDWWRFIFLNEGPKNKKILSRLPISNKENSTKKKFWLKRMMDKKKSNSKENFVKSKENVKNVTSVQHIQDALNLVKFQKMFKMPSRPISPIPPSSTSSLTSFSSFPSLTKN